MDKRYQVFISSTFNDLQEERKAVMAALQKAGFFVAGMELFPSDDDDSWEVIKRVIDQSDYYVLVIAGRYGSPGPEGKSYTEMEYDYAKERKIPVLAFTHSDSSQLPHARVEQARSVELAEFIKRVEKSHNRSTWTSKDDLATTVLASLTQQMYLRPAVGWVRGNAAGENDVLTKRLDDLQQRYNRVLDERNSLSERLNEVAGDDERLKFAWGDSNIKLVFETMPSEKVKEKKVLTIVRTWQNLFDILAPSLIGWTSRGSVGNRLVDTFGIPNDPDSSYRICNESLNAIRSQFVARGVIEVDEVSQRGEYFASRTEYWKLTELGLYEWSKTNAVLASDSE